MAQLREITTHRADPDTDLHLRIFASDNPGPAGENARYAIEVYQGPQGHLVGTTLLTFQRRPLKLALANGITNEALLAIVADRLEAFQKGPFRCLENMAALRHVHTALRALHQRTLDRKQRKVEGTNQP